MPEDKDYDQAAQALVNAMLGKDPEPEAMRPLTSAQQNRETIESFQRFNGQIVESFNIPLPATLPNDTRITRELATSGHEMRFEVEADGKLVAFTLPIAMVEAASEATINTIVNRMALEVIANGYINLAALQRQLSPDICTSCEDLGWKSETNTSSRRSFTPPITIIKWVKCPYCNNRYNKSVPTLEL